MKTYEEAIEWTYRTRWAGQKDGTKSRSNALAFFHGENPPRLKLALSGGIARGRMQVLVGRGDLSSSTVNRFLSGYLAVWGSMYQAGEVTEGPPEGLYLPEKAGRMRVVSETELGGLCAELPPAYGPLTVFLFETGCRVGEALKLERRDVDLSGRRVTFRDCKNGTDRTVPLTVKARLLLEHAPGSIFAHLSQSAFNHAWSTARERMGLQDDREFCPHALRHSAVTRWVVAGIPLPIVSQMAGHRSFKTTQRYCHTTIQDAQAALEKAGIR